MKTTILLLLGMTTALSAASTCLADEIQVAVPQSSFDARGEFTDSASAAPVEIMGLEALYWQPRDLELPSEIPDATSFKQGGTPGASLSYSRLLADDSGSRHAWGRLLARGSAGFDVLTRSGTLEFQGLSRTDEQNLYFIPLALGLEYQPRLPGDRWITPFADLSIAPSVLATTASFLADDTTLFGACVEGSAGVLAHAGSFDVRVGVDGTKGKIQSADMSGVGLRAGVSFAI